MPFDNIKTHIEKIKDKKSDKIIIRDVEDSSSSSSKPLAGYQSLTSNSSFKKANSSSTATPPKEYSFHTETDSSGKTLKFRKAVSDEKDLPPEDLRENFVLDIAPDHMSANIMVFKDNDRDYTVDEIINFLKEHRITYGIDMDKINAIVTGELYYEDVTIATGIAAIDGKDGYFDYAFNPKPETKPIILEDGSVDYNTLGKIELAYKDQLLATYRPLKKGLDGKNIFGEVLKAYEPIDLKPLKLSNVDYDPDTLEYYSVVEGKVTLEGDTLKITPIFIVNGNLEAATGNVDFHGDVIVKGNVFSNVTIKTTGNITIDGHVEIATLIAGKDILLKNGMQGSGVGRIKCGGNLMAKFLEQTIVRTGGNIDTNAILNCDTESKGSITVSGTRGAILGGKATAVEKIEAYSLGNRVGITTQIIIGLETDFKTAMSKVDTEIEECKERLSDAANGFTRTTYQMQHSKDPALAKEKMEHMRNKILEQSNLNELISKKESLADIRERSANGTIIIHGPANAGSFIIINGMTEVLNSEYKNVTFSKTPKEIRIHSNSIDDSKPRKGRRI